MDWLNEGYIVHNESGDHLEKNKNFQLSQTFLTQYSTFKTSSFTRNAFMTQVYIIVFFGI